MSHIVHSRNLFIDTSSGSGRGDNFNLELGANRVQADDGQFLRLTLLNFNMYHQIFPVNASNNKYRIVTRYNNNANLISTVKYLPSRFYKTVGDLALVFAEQLRAQVEADVRTVTGNNSITASLSGITTPDVMPPSSETFHSTGDRMLALKITCSQAHTLNSVKIECFESEGETWALLGGERIYDGQASHHVHVGENSLITGMSSTEVTIQSRYPMQRSTSPQIYLRCDLPNDNIETASLNRVGTSVDSTLSSNILGVFQMDHEFVHYDATNNEFILNLRSKSLSHMRLFLSDRKNRFLTHAGFESGPFSQSKLGSLNFSCIIRVDTIQTSLPKQLSVQPQPLPDQKQTGILIR